VAGVIELSRSKKTQLPNAPNGRKRYAINASLDVLQMKEDGVWEDIDASLDKNGLPKKVPYDLTPYLTGLPGFHYKSKNSGEFDVRLKCAKQSAGSIVEIPHKPNVKPVIKGRTITWTDYYPDVDVVLTMGNACVVLNRIIKSPSAPLEYDVEITEVEKGEAQLQPLKPATDAAGQLLKMEEKPSLDGRTETLKLEVLPLEGQEVKPITYPIRDSTIIEIGVGASTDDCYRRLVSSGFSLGFTGILAGLWSSTVKQYGSGIRFDGITITQDSTIDTSYITFTCKTARSGTVCNTRISAEATDDPNTFADDGAAFDTRFANNTDAVVDWDGMGAWTANTEYESPEIKTVIQEIVDRDGWSSGNAIVIFWEDFDDRSTGSASRRDAYSWDALDEDKVAQLYIEYTEGGAEPQELTAAVVSVASSVASSSISGDGDAPLTQAVVSVTSSVANASLSGSGNAPLTQAVIGAASSVINATIGYGQQYLAQSPVAVTSSIQTSAISGTGDAPLTAAVVSVTSSVQTATIQNSVQILTASVVSVTSSVQNTSISGSGDAPLTGAVVSVASSVVNTTITTTQILTQAVIAVSSSVVTSAIAGSGNAPLTGSVVAVTSSVVQAGISGSGNAPLAGTVVSVASSVINSAITHEKQYLASSPVAVDSSVEASAIAGSGIAPLTANVVGVASSVPNASLESGGQYLGASPISAASSVQNSAISGSGDAPLTGAVVSVVSSVMASAIAGTGNAPLTGAVVGVASSVVNPSIARTTQHLASSPVAVAASVQNGAIENVSLEQELLASPVAAASLVRTAAIAGAGTAGLNAVAIAVASSVAASSCKLTITSIIAITMKLHSRSTTSSLNPRSAEAELNQRDSDMELNPRSRTVKLNRRDTEIESPYGRE